MSPQIVDKFSPETCQGLLGSPARSAPISEPGISGDCSSAVAAEFGPPCYFQWESLGNMMRNHQQSGSTESRKYKTSWWFHPL